MAVSIHCWISPQLFTPRTLFVKQIPLHILLSKHFIVECFDKHMEPFPASQQKFMECVMPEY